MEDLDNACAKCTKGLDKWAVIKEGLLGLEGKKDLGFKETKGQPRHVFKLDFIESTQFCMRSYSFIEVVRFN